MTNAHPVRVSAVQSAASRTAQRIVATATQAQISNAFSAPPWNAPPPWKATTTYKVGHQVTGLTGDDVNNVYQLHSGTSATAADGISGTAGPTGKAAAQLDGTCVWTYLGRVSSQSSTLPNHLYFTAAPAATDVSATLDRNWTASTGVYSVTFTNGDKRDVTLTNGATTANWTGGLSAAALVLGVVKNPNAPTFAIVRITSATLDAEGISKAYGPWTTVSQIPDAEQYALFSCVLGGKASTPTVLDALGPPSGLAGTDRLNNRLYNSMLVETDADELVVFLANSGWSTTSSSWGVQVNGRFVYSGCQFRPQSAISSTIALRIDLSCFPANEPRTVRVFFRLISNGAASLRTAPKFTVRVPANPNRWRLAIEGDSLTSGSNTLPSISGQFYSEALAARLGCDVTYNNSIGGTSLAGNAGTKTSFIERVQELATFNPDVVIVGSTHNGVTSTQNVLDYVAAIRAVLGPNVLIFPCGSPVLQNEVMIAGGTQYTGETNCMVAAAQLASDPLVKFIPILTATPPWYSGAQAGNAAAPAGGTGDRFFYVSGALADSHPMWPGADYLATRTARAVLDICRSMLG